MNTEQTGWRQTSDLMARIAQLEASEANQHKWANQFKGERNEARKRAYELEAENARFRALAEDVKSSMCKFMEDQECTYWDMNSLYDKAVAALNHSGDANKMVAGALPKLNWKKLRDLAWERHGINLPDDHSHAILESLALECAIAEPANTGGKEGA